MPICSVCRSQNMDTAKFCGNCGNPFPRPSETTSSLLKCEQGHIYSAMYQACPYCPAVETVSSTTFETRIEEITAFVEPASAVAAPPHNDFATRIETPTFSSGDLATRIEAPVPAEFMTNIEVSPARQAEPEARAAAKVAEPLPGTELLTDAPGAAPPRYEAPRYDAPKFEGSRFETKLEESPFAAPPSSIPLPPPPPVPQAPPVVAAPVPPPMPPLPANPPVAPPPGGNRHTSVMAVDDVKKALGSKGKLVGWLVTYTRNPDGEDFRLRAGYNRMGANPACDIVVEDETVSGSHAILVFREGRCLIKDDLSRNGTFVNGKEITEAHPLQSYDQIRIGNTILTYIAAQNG